MPDHHVRDETRFLQRKRRTSDLLRVDDKALRPCKITMDTLSHLAVWCIDDLPDAGDRRLLTLGDEHYFVLGHGGQMARKVGILPGEVLMDEENFHGMGERARMQLATL